MGSLYQPLNFKLLSVNEVSELLQSSKISLDWAGRVIFIDYDNTSLVLFRQGLEIQLFFSSDVFHSLFDQEKKSQLKNNDIVSYFISGQVMSRIKKIDSYSVGIQVENFKFRTLVSSTAASPLSFTPRLNRVWMEFIHLIKIYFSEHLGFNEVDSPTLVPCPGMETHLNGFSTEVVMGQKRIKCYLPTSPEFHLKKMLASGWEKIFEIKKCFRNGERGPHHSLEFYMLEWYRAYACIESIMSDVENLLFFLAKNLSLKESLLKVNFSPFFQVERVSIKDLFMELFQFNLTPQTSVEELLDLASRLSLDLRGDRDWNDVFFRIFLEKVEPFLKEKQNPVLIFNFPPTQSALARIGEDGWAKRFELYWKGLELANAFDELNDPREQRKRFEQSLIEKEELGFDLVPMDESFLKALEYGLPPSGGIALGIERLFMCFYNLEHIKDLHPNVLSSSFEEEFES